MHDMDESTFNVGTIEFRGEHHLTLLSSNTTSVTPQFAPEALAFYALLLMFFRNRNMVQGAHKIVRRRQLVRAVCVSVGAQL